MLNKIIDFFYHLFIPKEENNYQPKLLHLDFLSFYLIFALFLTFGYRFLPQKALSVLGFATDITVNKLHQLTNQTRQKHNLPPLDYNKKLEQAAYLKAQDMFKRNYWAHYAPDGTTPWQFILTSGYRYQYAGENLAKNFLFSQDVVNAWMDSPTHRENILKKEYNEVGFAVVNGILNGEETTLVVQMFAQPAETGSLTQEQKTAPIVPAVQAEEKNLPAVSGPQTKINLSPLTYRVNLILFSFLTLALIADLYFAQKLGIFHLKRKNIFHLMFFGFIIVGLLLFTKGSII
jgi:hypothetical protein